MVGERHDLKKKDALKNVEDVAELVCGHLGCKWGSVLALKMVKKKIHPLNTIR